MPDLEQAAVMGWLTDTMSAAGQHWPPAIRPIETSSEIAMALNALGAALDHATKTDPSALARILCEPAHRAALAAVMAQLGSARILRLLHWMAEADLPDCHGVISALLQNTGDEGHFIRAVAGAVTSRAVVDRMFAPERLAALERACITVREST